MISVKSTFRKSNMLQNVDHSSRFKNLFLCSAFYWFNFIIIIIVMKIKNLISTLLIFSMVIQCSADIFDFKVTEIMYNPPDELPVNGSEFEFIEFKNTGSTFIDLSGLTLIAGISYSFSAGDGIDAGDFILLVSNITEFQNKYPGVTPFGQYTGRLNNAGENLRVAQGTDTIISIRFNDNLPWPVLADGNGFSMVPVDLNPVNNQNDAEDWRASASIGGSPGTDDGTPLAIPQILINELLTHTDLPDIDELEIYNPTNSTVDLSGWFLSDDRGNPRKFEFPAGTTISSNGYLRLDETDYNPGGTGFSFNRVGEWVFIFSADNMQELTGYSHGWDFGAQFNGTSFGIHTTSVNDMHFVAQSAQTFGGENAYPKVGPLVFTKIMYNPWPGDEEFLVIKNISNDNINLWSPIFPDSTWQVRGVSFSFPPGTSMDAGEEIVLTEVTASVFRTKHDLAPAMQVFQYFGQLQDNGERLLITATDNPDTNLMGIISVPRVVVDRVRYNDRAPWPISADGDGALLERLVNSDYGDDPANWQEGSTSFTGIEETGNLPRIEISPNPAAESIQIQGLEIGNEHILKIYNETGKQIFSEKLFRSTQDISLPDLSNGIYFWMVEKISFNFGNSVLEEGKLLIIQ